jgi:hypothetical protein
MVFFPQPVKALAGSRLSSAAPAPFAKRLAMIAEAARTNADAAAPRLGHRKAVWAVTDLLLEAANTALAVFSFP